MAVAVHVTLRGVTENQYDAVRAQAGWVEQPPAGGLAHTTWWEGDDCHNLDAWESEEAFRAFADQRLAPAMAAAGVSAQPEIVMQPAHEVLVPRATVVAPTLSPIITPADNVSRLRRGYEAFARGDVPAVLDLFDAAIDWYSPDSVSNGGRFSGPAAVAEFFSTLPQLYAELHVEPQTFLDHGDMVAVIGRHRGRSATGNAFELPWVHLWTLSNGKAISFTEYFDTVKLNTALGVVAQRMSQPAGVRA